MSEPTIEFKEFRRKQIAELADWREGFDMTGVSVSDADKAAGSPKIGDKIARNPKNHADRWLVAADYFADNFEPVKRLDSQPVPVEPVRCDWTHEAMVIKDDGDYVPIESYETLQSELKRVTEERDAANKTLETWKKEIEYQTHRAENAENQLRAALKTADDSDTDKLRAIGLYDSCSIERAEYRERAETAESRIKRMVKIMSDSVKKNSRQGGGGNERFTNPTRLAMSYLPSRLFAYYTMLLFLPTK